MIILSFGFKKPQSGDRGSIWFPALEFDIQRLNDHTHDGINSNKIPSSSVTVISQIIPVSWTLNGTANYDQTVTMPSGFTFDEYLVSFRKTSTGEVLYLSCSKVSSNTYKISTFDPTLDVTAIYTS